MDTSGNFDHQQGKNYEIGKFGKINQMLWIFIAYDIPGSQFLGNNSIKVDKLSLVKYCLK